MTRNVNVGLIGAGRIGRVHAENLAYRIPAVNLSAVADVFVDSAKKVAADFQIPVVTANPQEIFDNPDIDAIVICSSTDTHAEFISAAATAGKHIFCEKPIALDLAVIDKSLADVKKNDVKLQLGFNRRFDPHFKAARDMVAAGKIGTPEIVHIISRDPSPPPVEYIKVSGGIFMDQTIHDFDMARFLIGSEVEEIFAAGGVMVDPAIGQAGDIDTAVITLRYKNGAIGTIDNSRRAVYGYDQRVEVFGSKGSVVVANPTPHTAVYSHADTVESAKPLYFFLERYMDAYAAEMQVFVDCILNDTTPPVTGIDGRIPVVMGLAAWKSYRENRPVKLSEISA